MQFGTVNDMMLGGTTTDGTIDQESKEELKKRLDAQRVFASSLKDDYERCQRKLLGAELRIKELQTTTLVAKEAADEARLSSMQAVEEARRMSAAAEAKAASAIERLRFAPQVDNSLRRMYCELRHGCHYALGAFRLEDSDVQELHKKGSLEIVEDCRLWLKWVFANIATLQQSSQQLQVQCQQLQQATANSEAKLLAATAAATDVASSNQTKNDSAAASRNGRKVNVLRKTVSMAADSVNSGGGGGGVVSSSTAAAETPFDPETTDDINLLREHVRSAAVREEVIRERYERMADLARRDCASAKQDVRNHLKTIKELQSKLKKCEAVEVSIMALERARRETVEAKKHMSIAVSAKQQELDNTKRDFAKQMQTLLLDNTNLKRRQDDAAAKEATIEVLKSTAKNAELQLTRSGVMSATAEVSRLRKLAEDRADQVNALEQKLREAETTIQRLKRDCDVAATNYNALFAAHREDALSRQRQSESLKRSAVAKVIDSGALDIQMYREQYRQAKEEARLMKHKLLHLLVLTKKDGTARPRLPYAKPPSLVDDALTAPTGFFDDSSAAVASFSESALVPALGAEDMPSHEELERSRVMAERALGDSSEEGLDEDDYRLLLLDDASPNTSSVLRIANDSVTIDTRVPTFGAVNHYGNPFEPQGLAHVTASTPAPTLIPGEISLRAVPDVLDREASVQPSPKARRQPVKTFTASAKMSTDFRTLLSGEPRPSSATAVLTSIARRRGQPIEGFSKPLTKSSHRSTPHRSATPGNAATTTM